MTGPEMDPDTNEKIPTLQKLYDRPFLWLALGMVTMVAFYTAWGIFELLTMTQAPLP